MDEAGGARNLPPLPFPSLPFPLFVLLVGFKLNTRPQPPPSRGPAALACSPPGAEPPGQPAAASALLSSVLASQKATNFLPQLQRGGPHASISPPRLDFTPSQPGPPPACVPPCAPSCAGPTPPNVPSRPLPSAPPSWRGYYFILFFLVLGWPPKSFQPGILLPPSLPLPALRPPGRWKQNLGSSGLEGRGGNLLHGGKNEPSEVPALSTWDTSARLLVSDFPSSSQCPPGEPRAPHWAKRGSGGVAATQELPPRSEAAAFSAPCVRQGRAPSLWKGSRIYGKGPEVPPTPIWSPCSPPGLWGGEGSELPGWNRAPCCERAAPCPLFFSPLSHLRAPL